MNPEMPKAKKKCVFPFEWIVIPRFAYGYGAAGFAFLVTAYVIWIYSGMAMFVLLIATSPLTAQYESVNLNYAVWWGITALILVRTLWILGTIRPMTTKIFTKTLAFLWLYWVLMYAVMMVMVFKINSITWYQVLVLGLLGISIWFFKNLRNFVLK